MRIVDHTWTWKKKKIGSQMSLAMGIQTHLSRNYFIGFHKIKNKIKIIGY